MSLQTLWFLLIVVLWVGYFVLEGFDYGVGMLLPILGKTEEEKRVMINTIGPHWDGNEVWLLTAGGATFAAFPTWYATLFSGFYLPLLLVLAGLIIRALGLEYRGKRDSAQWRKWWDIAIPVGSLLPAFLFGVAFTNIVRGVPIIAHDILGNAITDPKQVPVSPLLQNVTDPIVNGHLARLDGIVGGNFIYTGSLWTLLNPLAILGGLTIVAVLLTYGAIFLALKTDGDIRHNARALATPVGVVAAACALVLMIILNVKQGAAWSWIFTVIAVLAFVAGWLANLAKREGFAFLGMFVAIGFVVVALFAMLYPNVMPSSTNALGTLTIFNSSSSHHTLMVMSWVALIFTPFALAYQAWAFWVFRQRISTKNIPPAHEPIEPEAVPVAG
ncbi:MAG: cytochrome d ubiquinol oxidase subunit II [Actinomycetia bacterium]|nr:cytochrome d ubiquinol oxidase subunit II [Actinomycetes bacterium]